MSVYSKIAKALSLLALILVFSPFLYAFVSNSFDASVDILIALVIPSILLFIGYFLQALMSRITKFKRSDNEFDSNMKYIDISRVTLPLVLCAAAFFPLCSLMQAYKEYTEVYFDRYALDIYLYPALCCLIMAAGVILWFYPYHKLLHIRLVYAYGAGFLIDAVISGLFSVNTVFHAICFVIFLGIFFTVSNLRSIEESLSASKFRVPSNDFRSYNLAMTVKHYLTTLLAAAVLFSAVYLIVSSIHVSPIDMSEDDKEAPGEVAYELVEGEEHKEGKEIEKNVKVSQGPSALSIICGIIVVGAFLGFVLYWLFRKHLLKRFFVILTDIFANIWEVVAAFFGMLEGKQEDDIPANYVDVESSVDCDVSYTHYGVIEELTPKSFDASLAAKDTYEEKLAYAYSVYCTLVRGDRYGIKISDTPRMINAKLTAQRKPDLEAATPLYETVRYRECSPKEGECRYRLGELVEMVKAML